MKAFEISLNGERKAICGAKNIKQLATMLTLSWPEKRTENNEDGIEFILDVQGLSVATKDEEEVVKWVRTKLNLGTELTVRIIDVDEADLPIDKQTIKSRREEFERHQFETAKDTYLRYRDKYEK